MKKCIAFLSALAIIGSSCVFSVTADQTDVLSGDVNNDGALTSRDIVMLSQFLIGAEHYDITKPDVNTDGDTNILDLILLKKILLEASSEISDKEIILKAEATEKSLLDFNYDFKENIEKKYVHTAVYIDSYEKMTEFVDQLSRDGIEYAEDLSEKYDRSFFADHTLAIGISSSFAKCGDLESVTVKDGVLALNVCGLEHTLPLPVVGYMAVSFSRDTVSNCKISDAEYRQTEMKSLYHEDLDISESNISIDIEPGKYKWINSEEELQTLLEDSSDTEDIKNKYNSEFFMTNSLMIYCGYTECAQVNINYDDKLMHISVVTDQTLNLKTLFIGIPESVDMNKEVIINTYNRECVDKPVIYLYPEEETEVSVSVDLNGRFTCVYPEFTDKENNMWTVTASPDGLLRTEDGSEYNYLFWEGIEDVDWDMSRGFVVKGSDTLSFLRNQLPKMGLTPKEYNDFIVFWLPQMQNNEYNYITFQTDKYTDNAVLSVTPDADSVLRVFMAYIPVNEDEAHKLSQTVKEPEFDNFERNGFTVVEWGGCKINK